MKSYDFTFTLGNVPTIPDEYTDDQFRTRICEILDEICGRTLATGCDDASLHSRGDTIFLSFHREAPSFAEAVASAIQAVEKAGYSVVRMEVDEELMP